MRFVIVGLGSIGARHLRNLRILYPNAQIAVLRRAVSAPVPVDGSDYVFRDLAEVIAFAPVAAFIAGPAPWHMTVATRLANAGVHLFIEKPIAIDLASARVLLSLCRKRGLALAVGYVMRFDPLLTKFRELVRSGAVGHAYSVRIEVGQYLPDWRPGTDYRQGVSARSELGGGVLLELSHEFDYLQWIFGMPKRVMAMGGHSGQLEIDVYDIAEVILDYGEKGPWVSIHLDMLQRQPVRRCKVVGSRGKVCWDGIAGAVDLSFEVGNLPQRFEKDALANLNQLYMAEIKNFLAIIQDGAVPACSGEEAVLALTLALAANQSIEQGCAVLVSN